MLKVVFHHGFHGVYAADPAAAPGRMEAVVETLEGRVNWVEAEPAAEEDLLAVHTPRHIRHVKDRDLYGIAALAAGASIRTALLGLEKPAFGLVRPPGHHASADNAWGFCLFNNLAVSLHALRNRGKIRRAFVLDIDLHYGDGTVNILGQSDHTRIANPNAGTRRGYLAEVEEVLPREGVDVVAVSAGFDHHVEDWGGLLETEDYREIGRLCARAARRCGAGLFGLLEGGYNHAVLGGNVLAFVTGMEEGWKAAPR